MGVFIRVLLAGLFDRVRGGFPEGERPKWVKYIALYSIGALVSTLVLPENLVAALVGGFLLGQGWRQDNGWRGRWVGGSLAIGRAMRWGALGVLFFVPIMAFFDLRFLLLWPCSIIGAPIAMFIAMHLPTTNWLQLRNAWPWSELIGWPVTLSLYVGLLSFLGMR